MATINLVSSPKPFRSGLKLFGMLRSYVQSERASYYKPDEIPAVEVEVHNESFN